MDIAESDQFFVLTFGRKEKSEKVSGEHCYNRTKKFSVKKLVIWDEKYLANIVIIELKNLALKS